MSLQNNEEYRGLKMEAMARVNLQDSLVQELAHKLKRRDILETPENIEKALYASAVSTGNVPQSVAILVSEFLLALEHKESTADVSATT